MNELYWITVLGNISHVNGIILVLGIIVLTILGILMFVYLDTYQGSEEDLKNDEGFSDLFNVFFVTICFVIFCTGVKIFVPSTQQLYMIYGLGGTIDYLQENETAKQLPDKVMIALDKCIDNLNVTKDTNKNEDE